MSDLWFDDERAWALGSVDKGRNADGRSRLQRRACTGGGDDWVMVDAWRRGQAEEGRRRRVLNVVARVCTAVDIATEVSSKTPSGRNGSSAGVPTWRRRVLGNSDVRRGPLWSRVVHSQRPSMLDITTLNFMHSPWRSPPPPLLPTSSSLPSLYLPPLMSPIPSSTLGRSFCATSHA